jgi:hypothetical protein
MSVVPPGDCSSRTGSGSSRRRASPAEARRFFFSFSMAAFSFLLG